MSERDCMASYRAASPMGTFSTGHCKTLQQLHVQRWRQLLQMSRAWLFLCLFGASAEI